MLRMNESVCTVTGITRPLPFTPRLVEEPVTAPRYPHLINNRGSGGVINASSSSSLHLSIYSRHYRTPPLPTPINSTLFPSIPQLHEGTWYQIAQCNGEGRKSGSMRDENFLVMLRRNSLKNAKRDSGTWETIFETEKRKAPIFLISHRRELLRKNFDRPWPPINNFSPLYFSFPAKREEECVICARKKKKKKEEERKCLPAIEIHVKRRDPLSLIRHFPRPALLITLHALSPIDPAPKVSPHFLAAQLQSFPLF